MKRNRLVVLTVVMVLAVLSASMVFAAGEPEIVDGRFTKTRKITVEIFDRSNPGGSKPEDNFYTDFIKEGMLRDHNVEVTFVPVPRWTEVEVLNNLLAGGDAPDICVTYDYPTILAYANMGGVLDMAPYLEEYKDLVPDLWDFLGEQNLYWNRDPEKGTVWAIEARLAHDTRINTFVREDWL
ncbi:MAG: sugar ABC transporter substrate-binding protein, partial [Firmicutes bacterium]|nr:sugar ABC transporter substrate-binding protein [Bacillota bacterium]